MHIIPLHSVSFAFGSSDRSRQRVIDRFPQHERVIPADVKREIAGDYYRNSIEHILGDEIVHRIIMRLRLGGRVIVDAEGMDRKIRSALIDRIVAFGTPVFAIVCSETENSVWRGAETIDARASEVKLVEPLPHDGAAEYLSARYRGITAIGDVHGTLNAFLSAIQWARSRGNYLVFSGDLIDYGPGSIEVADEAYRLVTRGEATLITGNHERKIMRWLDGYRVRLSDGNRVTTMGLMGLSDAARAKWSGRFRGLYQNSRLVQKFANLTFAHAAVHPSLWRGGEIDQVVENLAFFGEIDAHKSKPDRPVSSYRWADSIPAFHFAVVGHNILSRSFPILQTNTGGGNALFLDTGAGKGGRLSSADFHFHDGGLKLEHFNIY
jgi:hypothetical protein